MVYSIKEIFTAIGFVIGIAGLVPYVIDIFRHKTKPHSFSWLIWFLLTGIGFAGQIADHGGVGSWITATNSICCFIIFLLSLKFGEKTITKSDWISFTCALLAIPLWFFTKTPLYSMILISMIDALGFYPTFRKSWYNPQEETFSSWLIAGMMYWFGLLGLENYTVSTMLYPASIAFTNLSFCLFLFWRYKILKGNQNDH